MNNDGKGSSSRRPFGNSSTAVSRVELSQTPAEGEAIRFVLVKHKHGAEIVRFYNDLKAFCNDDLLLAKPQIETQGGSEITAVAYEIPAPAKDILEIDPGEFQRTLKDKVKQEVSRVKQKAEQLGNTQSGRDKKKILDFFELPVDFEENGHLHLRRVKGNSRLYLLNWGFKNKPDIFLPELPKGPAGKGKIVSIEEIKPAKEDGGLSLKAIINGNEGDFNYSWTVNGKAYEKATGPSLHLSKKELEELGPGKEVEVGLKVENPESVNDADQSTSNFKNPIEPGGRSGNGKGKLPKPPELPPLTVSIENKDFSRKQKVYEARLNRPDGEDLNYAWSLNDTQIGENSDELTLEPEDINGQPDDSTLSVKVSGTFDGKEQEVSASKDLKFTWEDKAKGWWESEENRRKVWIALFILLLLILLLWGMNQCTEDSNQGTEQRPVPEETSPGVEEDSPPGSNGNGTGQDNEDEDAPRKDEGENPPSESNEPIPPFTQSPESKPPATTPGELEREKQEKESQGISPTLVGEIFCMRIKDELLIWIETSGGARLSLDSVPADGNTCTAYIQSLRQPGK